ncbi:hypothetical protein QTP88_003590 [Uroleucon formosanum]
MYEKKLGNLERKILRKIFGLKKNEEGEFEIRTNEELRKLFGEADITGIMKSSRIRWAGHAKLVFNKEKTLLQEKLVLGHSYEPDSTIECQAGREEVEDNQRVGHPCSSKTNDNISKINEIVRKDRRLSIRMIAEMVNIDKETVRQILHDELNMTKVCAKMVPKNLTLEQKDGRRQICVDILKRMENERDLLKKTSASPKLKKARMSKSKLKAMLIVFFDIKGLIMTEWVPQGQTVNQHYYLQVLTTLRERVRRKRPELWENDSWILHQDNAPAHSALSV